MINLTDSAIRDKLSSYFTSVKFLPMDNNQTPQTPECVNEDRRAFLGTLAATVASCTTGLATKALADEISDDTELASLEIGASDDAQGSGIDDAQETLSIENQIAEIQQQIEVLEQKDPKTIDDRKELISLRRQLLELENQKQALGQKILAEEKSETAEQEAVIDEKDAAIETKTEIVENLEEINNALGNK